MSPTAYAYSPGMGTTALLVNDLESSRISSQNRLRSLTKDTVDKDGILRGGALGEEDPTVAALTAYVEELSNLEQRVIRSLQKQMKSHPLYPFVRDNLGIGEKLTARLLETIGDPFWHTLEDRPRTVSELWAYCGLAVNDGTAQRRTKGQQSNWSTDAKTYSYLMAERVMVSGKGRDSKFRDLYDEARAKYAEATHSADCVRCGPKGKPAKAGSPLSLAHQHARALRIVQKEILKDLWITARDWHEAQQ